MYETRFSDGRVAGEHDFVCSFGIAADHVVTAYAHRTNRRVKMHHVVCFVAR